MKIIFGALCDPLHEQTGMLKHEVEVEQKCADAITLLAVQGVLPDSQIHQARKRVMNSLMKKYNERPAKALE